MNISAVIRQFGYKPNEVKAYIAALGSVEMTASEIAAKAKLSLSSSELAIKKLHKDGLMNFYTRKSRKYWVAEPPVKLLEILKEKEENLASVLAAMRLTKDSQNGKPKVEVFLGDDEIKLIHDRMIEKKKNISAIIPWEAWSSLLGKEYISDFIVHRARHFLNIRMLVPKTSATVRLKDKDSAELRHTKFLPESAVIEDALFIFGDNVAIITLNERQPTGVIIEDAATTRMMNVFFDDFWQRSQE